MDDITRPSSGANKTTVGIRRNTDGQDAEDDAINLADYLRVVSKHRRMIFWICAIAVITTAVVSLLLSKSYAATATVVPPVDVLQKGLQMSGTGGLAAAQNSLLRKAIDVTSIADMYVGILRSRTIADALISRFELARVYHNKRYISDVRKILSKRTAVNVTDEGIVVVRVEDGDPCRAADMANAYVDELDRQNKRLSVGQATSKRIFLESRLKEIESELSRIENLLSREAKVKEMLFELLTREFEIAKIEEAKSMPTIQILDRAVIPEKKFKPKRTLMVFVSGVTALFVGVFAAFVREHLDRTRRTTVMP